MSRIKRGIIVGREVVKESQDDEIAFLAAAIAYYAFVSLIPMLLFIFVLASTIGGQELANQIVDQSSQYLAPAGQDTIEDVITGGEGRGGATIVGSAVLLWSALKLFRGLDTAFSFVFNARFNKSFIRRLVSAAIVFSAIFIAAFGLVVLGTVLVILPDVPFGFFTPLSLVAGLTVVFFPLYYYLPDVGAMSFKQAIPGAILAASGWAILHTLFGLYASNAGQYDIYGVVGGILLLLTWLYFGSIIIILGAVLNYVLMDQNNKLPNK